MSSPSSITDNEERSRLELRVDGELAGWLDYRPAGPSTIIAHTEVTNGHEGRGLGGVLVRRALEEARAAGKTVIATCPFALAYIDRHPELDEFLVPSARRRRSPD
ncbi:MAG: GNAT family N-acetyltransferase [Solirubrobacteraceae bacterium]|nr:GNAT family N-acetyltransferase [Solirubrobacteraceae bacterium]